MIVIKVLPHFTQISTLNISHCEKIFNGETFGKVFYDCNCNNLVSQELKIYLFLHVLVKMSTKDEHDLENKSILVQNISERARILLILITPYSCFIIILHCRIKSN